MEAPGGGFQMDAVAVCPAAEGYGSPAYKALAIALELLALLAQGPWCVPGGIE
jgi:hypothetical protein